MVRKNPKELFFSSLLQGNKIIIIIVAFTQTMIQRNRKIEIVKFSVLPFLHLANIFFYLEMPNGHSSSSWRLIRSEMSSTLQPNSELEQANGILSSNIRSAKNSLKY